MENLKIISTNDILKLLSHRVSFSFKELSIGDRHKMSFFKESLDLLGHVESFVSNINEGTAPTKEAYAEAVKSNNKKELKRICAYFSRLRHLAKLVADEHLTFSENYKVFKACYSFVEARKNLLMPRNKKEFAVSAIKLREDTLDEKYDWTVENCPYETCFTIMADIRKHLESNCVRYQQSEKKHFQEINEVYQGFDHLLEQHSTVYSLSLDIRLIHDFDHRNIENYAQFVKNALPDIQSVKTAISCLPSLLQAFLKVESDYQLGLNCHCILLFRVQPKVDEERIIQDLSNALMNILNGRQTFIIKNWNKVVRAYFFKSAVGVIRKDNTKQVEEFKYWNLSYFFRVDQYLRFQYCDEQGNDLVINDFFGSQLQDNATPAQSPEKTDPPIVFNSLLSENDEKLIWTVTHLSKEVRHRLSIAKVQYNEMASQNWELAHLVPLLLKIEIFIETLLCSSVLVFDFPIKLLNGVLTEKELASSTTRIGKQFLSLRRQGHQCTLLTKSADGLNCVSVYAKYFLSSRLASICCTSSDALNKPITQAEMEWCNEILRDFRSSCQKQISKVLSCYDSKKTNASEKTLVASLEYKYSVCQTRQRNVTHYVKQLFKKDCVLYRVQLTCNIQGRRLIQSDFSKLFTLFIRFGKRAKPLSWMQGYIGIWQEDVLHQPFVDVVFFLDSQAYDQRDNIIQQINEYWIKFINKKIESITDVSKDHVNGSASPIQLLRSVQEMNQPYLLIESIDKAKQKLIVNELIIYFSYRDLFQRQPTDKIPKAFIKGSLPQKTIRTEKIKSES